MTTDAHPWRKAKLQEFVAWSAAHTPGDEKGELIYNDYTLFAAEWLMQNSRE